MLIPELMGPEVVEGLDRPVVIGFVFGRKEHFTAHKQAQAENGAQAGGTALTFLQFHLCRQMLPVRMRSRQISVSAVCSGHHEDQQGWGSNGNFLNNTTVGTAAIKRTEHQHHTERRHFAVRLQRRRRTHKIWWCPCRCCNHAAFNRGRHLIIRNRKPSPDGWKS